MNEKRLFIVLVIALLASLALSWYVNGDASALLTV
jgi:hypothetical protein